MGFDIGGGVEAVKKAAVSYALPMLVGAFVVALVAGIIGKKL